ncbi:enoyl-CoA hydratase/isomerase family protein [Sphingobium sp. Cam5-1]|uniref:enoyl-CoA hydratase/isomerase family protein n=1 Tax=Sphingobium sp. Cam5-1 TaxID=2789327 RepID=UPI0018AD244E|nr:enoyl-CoA hydratase/isomerase family protein [Sphingobium sp. Cam5-1]QPI74881.1 enoyl-CoA hydratase/isomerase family protein [Sphingobium sp. Cam5-1]
MKGNVDTQWPDEGVALITVGDGGVSGSLTTCATVSLLADALEAAIEQKARVIVLASSMEGHWLEHAYLSDIVNLVEGKAATGDPAGWFRSLQLLNRGPAVTIAAINGDTSGGGCELGWGCDLRVAEEQARFSQPEVAIGAGTGIGGTSRLMRLIGRTATAEVVLTGRPLTAQRLYELGGLNRVVPKGKAVEEALALARHIASLPPQSVAGMKKMLGEAEDLNQSQGIENDQLISQGLFAHPDSVASMKAIQARFDAGEGMDQLYWKND